MGMILAVDDEPVVLRMCDTVLRRGGYEVTLAKSGEEALRTFAKRDSGPFELALIDVVLPGISGVEVAKRIQEAQPELPIILMTGFGPQEISSIIGDRNPFRIIWKPFKTESLLQMIENAIASANSGPRKPNTFGQPA